jgi:hypothetical protein
VLVCPKRAKLAFILPSISAQLLVCPKKAKLPSYLCLLIYVTLSIYACLFAPSGQISKHKATKGYANACLWIVCTYGANKQA